MKTHVTAALSTHACCASTWPAWLRRLGRFFSWIMPGAVLVLMPKCPACLVAYIAVGTGIGLSLPTAQWLRTGGLTLSAALLGVLALRPAMRLGSTLIRRR